MFKIYVFIILISLGLTVQGNGFNLLREHLSKLSVDSCTYMVNYLEGGTVEVNQINVKKGEEDESTSVFQIELSNSQQNSKGETTEGQQNRNLYGKLANKYFVKARKTNRNELLSRCEKYSQVVSKVFSDNAKKIAAGKLQSSELYTRALVEPNLSASHQWLDEITNWLLERDFYDKQQLEQMVHRSFTSWFSNLLRNKNTNKENSDSTGKSEQKIKIGDQVFQLTGVNGGKINFSPQELEIIKEQIISTLQNSNTDSNNFKIRAQIDPNSHQETEYVETNKYNEEYEEREEYKEKEYKEKEKYEEKEIEGDDSVAQEKKVHNSEHKETTPNLIETQNTQSKSKSQSQSQSQINEEEYFEEYSEPIVFSAPTNYVYE